MAITCLIIIAEGRYPSPSSALVDDSDYFQIEVSLFFFLSHVTFFAVTFRLTSLFIFFISLSPWDAGGVKDSRNMSPRCVIPPRINYQPVSITNLN